MPAPLTEMTRFRGLRNRLPGLLLALSPASAGAHSFGKTFNLPVPFWMYAYGATAALVISFLILGFFVSGEAAATPRSRDISGAWWVRQARRWRLLRAARVLSVAALFACMLTGWLGTANPYTNLNMTLFWIWFVLGLTYLTALTGDVYCRINPWRALAVALARAWPRYAQGRVAYPARLGWWPALAFYMAFIWIELFSHQRPLALANLLAIYTALNIAGVWLIGMRDWFGYCEFFSVYFRLVGMMGPLALTPAGVSLRAPFSGLLERPAPSMSLLWFALFMLSSTAFDGLHESAPWVKWFWVDLYGQLKPWVGDNPIQAYRVLMPYYYAWATFCLLASPFVYGAVYLFFIALAKWLARSELPVRELALRFAWSLLPIALVYHVTHYYTLLLSQGVQIAHIVSDPLGRGWDIFGTAWFLRAPLLPSATSVWHTQVGLILTGHIVSVWLAHVQALRTFPTRRQALMSQLPLLVLMVLFTTAGLWILSQPIRSI